MIKVVVVYQGSPSVTLLFLGWRQRSGRAPVTKGPDRSQHRGQGGHHVTKGPDRSRHRGGRVSAMSNLLKKSIKSRGKQQFKKTVETLQTEISLVRIEPLSLSLSLFLPVFSPPLFLINMFITVIT